MRLEEGPADAVEAADGERRELLERGGREVDAAGRAAGAGVRDGHGDRLAVRGGHLHLLAAHRVPVVRAFKWACQHNGAEKEGKGEGG